MNVLLFNFTSDELQVEMIKFAEVEYDDTCSQATCFGKTILRFNLYQASSNSDSVAYCQVLFCTMKSPKVKQFIQILFPIVLLVQCVICDQLVLKSNLTDEELINIGSCTARCSSDGSDSKSLEKCYTKCEEEPVLENVITRNNDSSLSINLVCHDSATLVISFENRNKNSSSSNTTYVVKAQLEEQSNDSVAIVLSNETVVDISNLSANSVYKITVIAFNSIEENTIFEQLQEFKTLPLDYTPEIISEVDMKDFQINEQNKTLVDAIISWKPAFDRACHYEVLHYASRSPHFQLNPTNIHTTGSFQFVIESLELNSEYEVAVRAKNPPQESDLHWKTFRTPSCAEVTNNSRICAPEEINHLRVTAVHLSGDEFQLNISWDTPKILPDSYDLHVYDLNPDLSEDSTHSVSFNTSGNVTNALLESFPIRGSQYEVFIVARANNRTTSHSVIGSAPTKLAPRNHWIDALIGAIIIAVVIGLKFLISFLYKRHRAVNEYDKTFAWKGLELSTDIEIKVEGTEGTLQSTVLPGELIAPIKDEMELELERVQLLDVLGEGAFGLVRRGLLRSAQGDVKLDIAVKMLKECPTLTDIKAFRREIEVMKSVGSHPNIVCILGHYTRNVTSMMLVTEYCSEGDLLNYLRSAWDRILQSRSPSLNKADTKLEVLHYEVPRSIFEPEPLRYVNHPEGTSSTTSTIDNKLYHHQKNQKESTNVFDNRCYYSEEDKPKDRLQITSDQLIAFARQISTGMEFLARNKVVHRDLAARNVLVCANKQTVKISDFGLSRDIYQNNIYQKTTSGKLPIKWLALESLTHQVYTSQSDVWSFGIVLYEICTLGGNPYPLLSTSNLLMALKKGYRMEQPAGCSEELYALMMSCWSALPSERPTFAWVKDRLEKLVARSGESGEPVIDLEAIVE